jgi:predicted metal-dependent phosphoesterase TrpH
MAASGTQRGFDLHTHSVFSDGTTRPAEIASEAARLGLAGFALTDHDTIDGWDEARRAAGEHGVDFLPGIEITTKHTGGSRHLLGYGIESSAGELFEAHDDVRTVGRPHIADALVAAGYFDDRSSAFEQVLHPGSPYYLGTHAIDTIDAIRMVRAAGGVAVLAHPAAFRQRRPSSARELQEFAEAGLWGIELHHPENRMDWLPPLEEAAARLGLAVTGSSDYHGAGKPNRLGERSTDPALVERLRALVVTPR